ncbi:hypothetical protein NDU88_003427 [Pleurodeles waltl]|uniref:Uncharacterized protein n=1 Tax=Pleurodeles waltl TaxID=8319 RepID=A0AAV7QCQ9_PLEWA|nr:hypothetical protein NDU88_003427 [Pleurodeles waltl]
MFLWAGILRHRRCRGSGSAPCCSPPSSSPRMLQRQRPQFQAGRGHPAEVTPRARWAFFIPPAQPPRSAPARVGAASASTRFSGRLANFTAFLWAVSAQPLGSLLTSAASITPPRPSRPVVAGPGSLRNAHVASSAGSHRSPTAASRSHSHTGAAQPLN